MQRATQQGVSNSRGSKCHDCGNQAKKECSYSRCRTCCKNKGFHCQTHIKSTWTPVDNIRRRHIPQNHKPYSELKFPGATNSMAIFRCVKVRSMDDAVNEVAYQTSVNIGGHVFNGLLYDQGPDQSYNNNYKGESSTSIVDQQQNNLGFMNINNGSIQRRGSRGASASATMASVGPEETLLTPSPYPFSLASFSARGIYGWI